MQSCLSFFLKQIRLHIGMYSVYFERWLNKIGPEQFYVTTLEEYRLDKNKILSEILHFLNIGSFMFLFYLVTLFLQYFQNFWS